LLHRAAFHLDQVQGNAFSRARTDAGQLAQRRYETIYGFRKSSHVASSAEEEDEGRPRSIPRPSSSHSGDIKSGRHLAHFRLGHFLGLGHGANGAAENQRNQKGFFLS
jgi:hypothetical protein